MSFVSLLFPWRGELPDDWRQPLSFRASNGRRPHPVLGNSNGRDSVVDYTFFDPRNRGFARGGIPRERPRCDSGGAQFGFADGVGNAQDNRDTGEPAERETHNRAHQHECRYPA